MKACDRQLAALKEAVSTRSRKEQLVEVRRLVTIGRELSERTDAPSLRACRRATAALLRELATTWHREAQKTQSQDTYALAQRVYKAYLESFPKDKDAYVLSFYHAELLFKLERWEEAAEAYTKVVKMKPGGKHLKEAAYAAVLSWNNALNVEREIRDVSRRHAGLDPRPIPPKQKRMLAAFDTYIKHAPKSEELVPIKYRKARIYYENNRFNKAAELFGEIAAKHAGHELAIYSANLLLDSLNLLKRYGEMERWVERFLNQPKLARGEFLVQLRRLKRAVLRRRAEELRKAGRYRACGERFVALAGERHGRWSEAAYNAAICFDAAKLTHTAMAVRQALILRKPNDPLARKALVMIGNSHEALGQEARAAETYAAFAEKYPGEREAPDLLQRAIQLWRRLGLHAKARDGSWRFAKYYGGRARYQTRAARQILTIGSGLEQQGKWVEATRHYQSYLKRWSARGGLALKMLAHARLGGALWRRSCPVEGVHGLCAQQRTRLVRVGLPLARRLVVVKRRVARARAAREQLARVLDLHRQQPGQRGSLVQEAAAEAHFCLGEALFEDFLAIPRPKRSSNERDRARHLERKRAALDRAMASYQAAVLNHLPHRVVAASARLAQLHIVFAEELVGGPLADKVGVLAGKGRQALGVCLQRASKLARSTKWTELCIKELARITASPGLFVPRKM